MKTNSLARNSFQLLPNNNLILAGLFESYSHCKPNVNSLCKQTAAMISLARLRNFVE